MKRSGENTCNYLLKAATKNMTFLSVEVRDATSPDMYVLDDPLSKRTQRYSVDVLYQQYAF